MSPSPRLTALLPLALALAIGLSCPRASGAAPSPGNAPRAIVGFRPADAERERERESTFAIVHADSLRRHLRILTAVPHVAGTPADRATADYVRDRLEAYGWDAKIEAIPVYLNYPKLSRLEMVEPTLQSLAMRERGVEGDKDAWDDAAFDAFHGYSASGDVTAPVVYANYGDVDDFKKLTELGIDVRGKIALVRYGSIFRGLKVRNAERAGAAGVVIYSDPADDGYARADAYPRGPARPSDAIQRGSVQFLSEAPGDPTTPGWPSLPNGKRLRPDQARGVPRIPSIPIAWSEARKILEELEGPQAPNGWQGGLPLTYHVGEGPAKLHLESVQDYAVRPIWNVIATLRGAESPEQRVICGNHRDAWTYGAVDPNSGTICLLEMARAIGALAKGGWHPRRTIMLCSWDGEEYGLLGSTEWSEAHEKELASAVAYLNIDVAVAGKNFRVNGCHALRDVLVGAMEEVPMPGTGSNMFQAWKDNVWSDGKVEWARRNRERRWRGEPARAFEMNVAPLGSGSDYTSFVDHFGVPALDLRFEGLQGTYHSMYDDFDYMDRVIDPTYRYHAAITELWGRVTMRLAGAEVLPLRYSNTGQFVLDELQSLDEKIDDANAGANVDTMRLVVDLARVRAAATRLRDAGAALEARTDAALAGGGAPAASEAAVNAALIGAERALLGPGLPGRPWFRHELYAPGLNTGYAPVSLPRIGQAVLDKDRRALRAAPDPIEQALIRAATELERAPR
jgi:N-acetylated-alpha-linked acidic dipeptidase